MNNVLAAILIGLLVGSAVSAIAEKPLNDALLLENQTLQQDNLRRLEVMEELLK